MTKLLTQSNAQGVDTCLIGPKDTSRIVKLVAHPKEMQATAQPPYFGEGLATKDGHEEKKTITDKDVNSYQMTKVHFQNILSLRKLNDIV